MNDLMNNNISLTGKVVVVTGAGRGVGRGIATYLAQSGAKVVVNDIGTSLNGDGTDESPAEQVVTEILNAGGEATASTDSVSTWEGANKIIQTAIDSFGRVDAVVHSAGVLRDTIFHKMTEDDFDKVISVHLKGAFNICRACAPIFRGQESGCFVNMTSTSALIGSIGQANYSAAKMGIVGLTRSISLDMARYNVRANCIAPHAFSRMIESVPGKDAASREAELEKRRQSTRPEQIAPLIAFLCSDASAPITGQIFGARGNEIYLYNQPRPIRTLHRSNGWCLDSLAETLPNALQSSFTPAERTKDVFPWDPI